MAGDECWKGGSQKTVSPGKNKVLSPGPCPTVLATSKSLSLTAPSPSVSPSVSASPQGPRALRLALRRACTLGSKVSVPLPEPAKSARKFFRREATRLWALSLRDLPASRVRRIALLLSASACDHTVRQTP
ncbi:hypothetical protein M378DRAFT_493772 [Amanita muscaria Koide BX008]|uniref:Uncharacterized protein n=1 Tax=Amanita muscaria (strain Koide BX008) TaxID=946122 RepID=A0A0C2TU41_AMAMK|nr:hypothetical protein M378DRAFT_493772 [Amanita muscaria Koide BX008]